MAGAVFSSRLYVKAAIRSTSDDFPRHRWTALWPADRRVVRGSDVNVVKRFRMMVNAGNNVFGHSHIIFNALL